MSANGRLADFGPFTRCATVRIRLQFLDIDDAPVNPPAAELHLDFPTAVGQFALNPHTILATASLLDDPGLHIIFPVPMGQLGSVRGGNVTYRTNQS